MAHVPEHHSEHEGEGYDRDRHGVSLKVSGDAVGVDDCLEHVGQVSYLVEGGGFDIEVVFYSRDFGGRLTS